MNGQWADFTKQKCFFPFSISSNKPSILLAFWDILWYYGNREKAKKGAYYVIRIAVVDDEKAVCDELLFFLKEYEMKFKMIFDISIYYNGENLLADLEDDIHFDLILLDIELAKINGVEVGRHNG